MKTPSRVLLVGKDGGVKLRTDELDMQQIFDLIDAMPMRIQEMRQHEEEAGALKKFSEPKMIVFGGFDLQEKVRLSIKFQ